MRREGALRRSAELREAIKKGAELLRFSFFIFALLSLPFPGAMPMH
jgi:hypothetical protein